MESGRRGRARSGLGLREGWPEGKTGERTTGVGMLDSGTKGCSSTCLRRVPGAKGRSAIARSGRRKVLVWVLFRHSDGRAQSRKIGTRRERCKQQQPESGRSGCGEEGEARDDRQQTVVERDRHSVIRSSEVGRSSSAQGYMGVNWVSLAQNSVGWLFGPLASWAAADGDCKVPGLAK